MLSTLLLFLPEAGTFAQTPKYPAVIVDDAALLFATTEPGITFTVDITPAGFVFNSNAVQYYPTIPDVNSGIVMDNQGAGYSPPGTQYPNNDDFPWTDSIGCGRYQITISAVGFTPATFTIDFTDSNWYNIGNAYCVVIWIEAWAPIDSIATYAALTRHSDKTSYEYGYHYFPDLKYWEMIRSAVPDDSLYERNRNGFVLPAGDYPVNGVSTIINSATLDVNVTIIPYIGNKNIVIGYGKELTITNDPWQWMVIPDGLLTILRFEEETGFIVNGGSLHAVVSMGVIYWEPAATTWEGISINTTAEVVLYSGHIRGAAKTGLSLGYCNAGNVTVTAYVSSDNAGDGVNIRYSDPHFLGSAFSDNTGSGAKVFYSDGAKFRHSYFDKNNGYGTWIENSTALFESCQIYLNQSHGVYAGNQPRVRIDSCNIREQTSAAGIYMNDFSGAGYIELQNSCVYHNQVGLELHGESLLRGWHLRFNGYKKCSHNDIDGKNGIIDNDTTIKAYDNSFIELGRTMPDDEGVVCTFGGWNDLIFGPSSTMHCVLYDDANVNLVECYWDPLFHIDISGQAILEDYPMLGAATGVCEELQKAALLAQLPESVRELAELIGFIPENDAPPLTQLFTALRMYRTPEGTDNTNRNVPVQYLPMTVSPNPFTALTDIRFTLPTEEQNLSLCVYDMLGRQVAVLAQGAFSRGAHEVTFNAGSLSAGMYTAVLFNAERVIAFSRLIVTK